MVTKKLNDLVKVIQRYEVVCGSVDADVTSVTLDSRDVVKGSAFIAQRGDTVDGHGFIVDAIERGAGSVIGEGFDEQQIELATERNVALVRVDDTRRMGGVIVAAFYDFPFLQMTMIGVTGTDGKTTTTNAIYTLLKSLGKKVGLISTVNAKVFDGVSESAMDTGLHVTTPEVTEIQRLLSEMVKSGCEYAIVECTSHGFVQGRLRGINFDLVGITNITHEHLDYHKTFENYLAAKAMIFDIDPLLPAKETKRIAYINADDERSAGFRAYTQQWDTRTFSLEGHGILNANITSLSIQGTSFDVNTTTYHTSLVGAYNVANITMALGLIHSLGYTFEQLSEGVSAISFPPGRFEVVNAGTFGTVIIDFAHTPRAMESVVSFVRNHHKGRLFVVFGCAGLRDVEKRPMMGRIAGRLADVTVVTAEDPRTERVADIIQQIADGLEAVGAREITLSNQRAEMRDYSVYVRIEDRFEAIETAMMAASEGDVVMILGKGHEQSMCFGTTEVPWSDREAVNRVIAESKKV